MNNYCTNCGAKLKSKDLICPNCNTPIIDVPDKIVDKNERKSIKKAIAILICVLAGLVIYSGLAAFISKTKSDKAKNDIIIPYVKAYYNLDDYEIEYSGKGKCIISGDCYMEPIVVCDGNACTKYEYLPRHECTAYYFYIKEKGSSEDVKKRITAVYHNNETYAVEGINIYDARYNDDN